MTRIIKVYSLATTYPESQSSTKPKFVHLLNKELSKLGVSVKAIVPHSKDSLTKETMDGVRIKRFRYLPSKYELRGASIPDEIKKSQTGKLKIILMTLSFFVFTIFECLKERPDILHGQWAFPAGYLAYLISKLFRKKCVISIHGAETPLLKKYKFICKQTINSLNKCSMVIVNSNYTKEEYIKLGVNKDKIIRIKPIPNFAAHVSDKEIIYKFKRKFATDDYKIILFVGRLVERKGVEYLIHALPRIKTKNTHLVIAGGGGQEDYLRKLTSSLQLNDRITFFGKASDIELGLLHDIADVFVCPSIIDSQGETEGLGLVIAESMESKIPVIGTSVGGIPDIIQNEINGILVNEKDPISLANAIDKILGNPEFTKKIIENSKETIKEFSPDLIAKKHLEIFQKLVS